jgi:hypothetical protein
MTVDQGKRSRGGPAALARYRALEGEHTRPTALAAVGATVVDMSAHVRLEHHANSVCRMWCSGGHQVAMPSVKTEKARSIGAFTTIDSRTAVSVGDPLYRAVVSQIAKTMRAKRGSLKDGGAELGE